MRTLLSILAGFGLWTLLWCTSNFAASALMPDAFGADGAVHHSGLLVAFVVLPFGFSLLAGFTTARIARDRARRAALILAGIQLTIGVLVQAAYWELMPLWYHLLFLGLLVPGILLGARVGRAPGAAVPAPA